MRQTLCAAFFVALLAQPALAQREASTAHLGTKVPNLTFKDENGQPHSLYHLKNQKAIVLVFFSFECPVSNSYAQPLADMAKEYGKHGVSFIGLTVNEDDTSAQVAKQAREADLNFPVYLDVKLVAANALKADITPECFVLDSDYVLRYRGRIDDSWAQRLKKHNQVTRHDLRQVIGELLSGRPVAQPATLAIGCSIPRDVREIAKSGKVTYHRDVAPLLQKNCQQCHRPGEVGPFALMNYKQAVNWADDIKSYTQSRQMPPWKAVDGPAFFNDRRMAQKDIDTLAAWVDGGCPEGNPKDAPPPRVFPDGWQLGQPDMILTAESEFTLGPTGPDLFRCFVYPTHLTEDKYVTAVEVRPSNPRVVHHTLIFIDGTGAGRRLEKLAQAKKKPNDDAHADEILDQGPGYTMAMGVGFQPQGGMGGWAPGQIGRFLPDKSGYFLPKNSDLVMQIHFHRNGRLEKDRTQVGLYFAKNKENQPWRTSAIAGGGSGKGALRMFFTIPAGEERFPIHGDMWATGDFTLRTVMPHMHMVGKEIKVTMTPPGGQAKTLVAVKDWDYNWQETYMFKEPIQVKKGTHFHVDAFYDNSTKNPNNPFNPPSRVTFGEQTTNEMCFVFLGGTGNPRKGRGLPMSSDAPPEEPGTTKTSARVDEPKKAAEAKKLDKEQLVPFKLTDTQHIMVRVKINGKGPYNFIVDTGAPIMFVASPVGKKIGLETPPKGFTVIDKLEFEGGLTLSKVECRVETPFQLEGMNGMGLPGVELHGILGYTILANYRMSFDFTKHNLRWTPLDWSPPPPKGIGGKGQGGLEIFGSLMKFLGPLMGLRPAGPPDVRGFLGLELAEKDGSVAISRIVSEGPAADSGLKNGDFIQKINGQEVKNSADVHRLTARVRSGQAVRLTVRRGDDQIDVRITAGEGL